ncbi:MAG: hypothetical protein IIC74_07445, partial [Bacteroidetes bacterium]|nr:hypothetical protein [Bacteroidota bacterium]
MPTYKNKNGTAITPNAYIKNSIIRKAYTKQDLIFKVNKWYRDNVYNDNNFR